MDRLESVFIDGDPISAENNGNSWQSFHGENKKLKIGEVFQLENKTLSLSCIRCCETFQYFTEFSLHIQEHYLQGDIANLKEVKEEPAEDVQDGSIENLPNLQKILFQTMKNDESSNDSVNSNPADSNYNSFCKFQENFEAKDIMNVQSEAKSDDESKEITLKIETTVDNSNQSFGVPKTLEFVEGEHYNKDGRFKRCLTCDRIIERWDHLKDHLYTHVAEKNVICPLCSKAFTSIAYVRKHCGKVHKKKISSIEIRKAQNLAGGASNVVKITIRSNLNETNSKEPAFTEKFHESSDKMVSPMKRYQCKQCDKKFNQPRYLQKHMRCVHALKVQIQSIINGAQPMPTMHESDIIAERRTCDESEKNYQCYICKRQVKTIQSLKKHFKLHNGKKYKCFVEECERIFAQPHYVMDHIAIVHGLKKTSALRAKVQAVVPDSDYYYLESESKNVSSYQCYLCKNEYSSKLRLSVHFKIHLNGPFLCSHCGGTYKSADTLRHHMERHKANPDEPVQCPKCDKTYPTRRYMLRHFRLMHAADREGLKPKSAKLQKIDTKMFDCEMDQCDRKFSSLSRMKQHLATHNRRSEVCDVCGWTCSIRSNLNQHKKVHSTEESLTKSACTICNKLLSIRYLRDHMRMHAGLKSTQCDSCGKKFFNSQRLKRHIRVVHTRELKFKCEVKNCMKSFLTSDKLLIHRRNHEEKMDFVCSVCRKGFYSIKSLRKHSNAHYLEGHSIASLKLETKPHV